MQGFSCYLKKALKGTQTLCKRTRSKTEIVNQIPNFKNKKK